MLLPRARWARAALCLCLCLDLAAAVRFALVKRDEATPTGTSAKLPTASPSSSITDGSDVDSNSTTVPPSSSTSMASITPTSSVLSSMTALPTSVNSTDNPLNATLFNTTVPNGELPLTPSITPAFAVGGVILLGTGIGYGFGGIKSKWVHSFMAAAYLGSLGTSILILYVMTPPVSNAIQGAYLVAIVCTGLILGGAALVFKEITECLACLLGGFCLSMWLLTLGRGGLVAQTGGKVGFILAFTLAAFATYFSRWTRHYSLMACISFAGATAAVLGIDCFGRAGLKEFWAYIWALNDHLFPPGADTYPLTRGIKVELAATILIFLAGMMSQLKLWRVIQKKRAQRERQRAEEARRAETEDLSIGRRVERAAHRERRHWERVYGDGAELGFADSGVADMGSETKLGNSAPTVTSSRVVSPAPEEDQSQMVEIPIDDGAPTRRRTVLFQETRATRASVRNSQVQARAGPDSGSADAGADEKVWVDGSDGEARPVKDTDQTSRTRSASPEIVPLPFTVPIAEEDAAQSDRSSVAADVDDDGEVRSLPDSRRNSLAKRLSVGSGKILRSLSQRSKANTVASYSGAGESSEELVLPRHSRRFDDNDSLAATLDDLSSDGRDSDTDHEGSRRSSDLERPLSKHTDEEKRKSEERSTRAWLSPSKSKFADREPPTAEAVPTRQIPAEEEDATAEPDKSPAEAEQVDRSKDTTEDAASSIKGSETTPRKTKSDASAETGSTILKPEHLPRPLSRVAMSYRTNEWAKHLGHAETPEPENLESTEYHGGASEPIVEEPAPVDMEELQKTADNAARPAAAPRSASAMSNYSSVPQVLSRTNSKASLMRADSRNISPTGQSFPPQVHKNPKRGANNRRTSTLLLAQPIAEEAGDGIVSRSPTIPEEGYASAPYSTAPSPAPVDPISASASTANLLSNTRPPVPGVVSYTSPQTLIGKRDMLLRSKSQASFYGAPEPGTHHLPTIHSRPSSVSGGGSLYHHNPDSLGPANSSRTSLDNNADLDDLPLSHRRHLLRQSSLDLPTAAAHHQQQPTLLPPPTATTAAFDSHQPLSRRASATVDPRARAAQLASFRSSVQADLRHGAAYAGWAPYGGGGSSGVATTTPAAAAAAAIGGWDADVRRSVDARRGALLGAKEAEARRREAARAGRERAEAGFEERMRRGELLGAHRDAMRRLQGGVRDL